MIPVSLIQLHFAQVYQEADGTLIDDDSIFEALCEEAKANKQKLCIMLLPLGTEWKRVGESGTNQGK